MPDPSAPPAASPGPNAPPAGRPRWRLSRLQRAAFTLLMATGVLGFAEAAGAIVWFATVPRGERTQVERMLRAGAGRANEAARFVPHPYFNFVNNPGFATGRGVRIHHPIGIRATEARLFDKPDGVFRIVAFGASTTYGYYFDDARDTWPALLEARLRSRFGPAIEVINVAVPGHTTFEMIGIAALWLPEMRPDAVILTAGVNDAFAVGYPDEGGPDSATFRRAWSWQPPPAWKRVLLRRSHLARTLWRSWLARDGAAAGDFTAAMQHRRPPDAAIADHAARATGKYFRRNLATLVLLIRHAGAAPVLATNPLNPARETGQGPYYDAVSGAIRRNNDIILETGRRAGLPVVDLYRGIRDPVLFRDAAHATAAGMSLTATLVETGVAPLLERRPAVVTSRRPARP